MTFAEMDPLGAVVLVTAIVGVVASVGWAAFEDWRRANLRRPGRLDTPFGLEGRPTTYDFHNLRQATPLGRSKARRN